MLALAKFAIAASGCMIFGTGAAQADPTYDRCIDSASDNASWSDCGTALIAREDARLNGVWKQVYGRTGGQTKIDLLAEQRSWIAFKDASCKFYANGESGREGAVLSFPACRAKVISDRTDALQAIGKALQGN